MIISTVAFVLAIIIAIPLYLIGFKVFIGIVKIIHRCSSENFKKDIGDIEDW
jgi:hypothetical protein